MIRATMAAVLLLPPAGGAAARRPGADEWRRVATAEDRRRLREWRSAWLDGLAQARRTAEGGAAVVADAALFDPDGALSRPLPPDGAYRCRTIKLGDRGGRGTGLGYIAYGWFRCRVDGDAFAKVDGSQRPVGTIRADTDARAVFLGTLVLGDEARAMAYGRDRGRDLAGLVERIGPARWRIVLPYPRHESLLDIVELRPADQRGAAGTGVDEIGGSAAR